MGEGRTPGSPDAAGAPVASRTVDAGPPSSASGTGASGAGASGTAAPRRSGSDLGPARLTITVEGHGSASATSAERVLVALERAQGFGQLTGLARRLPVGCRRGGCGICRARVLAGAYVPAPMSRCHVSAQDEAAGVVLACAIYARSDLTLRLEPPRPGKKEGGEPAPQVVRS